MPLYDWQALEKLHQNFRAPSAEIKVQGSALLTPGVRLESLDCHLGTGEQASSCVITLGGVYDRKASRFSCESLLVLGSKVEVSLGYMTRRSVFTGYLYAVRYELGEEARAVLNCMDVKGAMMEAGSVTGAASYRAAITGMFTGKLARGYSALCAAPKLVGLTELDSPIAFSTTGLDDYAFLRETARLWGLEWFVECAVMHLRKKPTGKTELLTLTPGCLHNLSVEFTTVGYVQAVEVRGGTDDVRDANKKRASAKVVGRYRPAPTGTPQARLLARTDAIYASSVRDGKSAKALAEARLRLHERQSGEAALTLRGLAELMPGYFLRLGGASPKINGRYYITDVTHTLDEREFVTRVLCRRDSA